MVSPEGDVAYADSVVLEDTLRDGVIENLLLVLADGGRLAADRAERRDGVTTLYRAAYTACAVVDADGCPKEPTWKITAVRVVHDPVRRRISYRGATLNLFGMPLIPPARPFASRRQPGRQHAACSSPTSGSTGPTASSSRSLIISASRPTAT